MLNRGAVAKLADDDSDMEPPELRAPEPIPASDCCDWSDPPFPSADAFFCCCDGVDFGVATPPPTLVVLLSLSSDCKMRVTSSASDTSDRMLQPGTPTPLVKPKPGSGTMVRPWVEAKRAE